ncbi:MAG: RadC family protein [Acholeplasmataceae bacterium]
MYILKEMPKDQRPRERLIEKGVGSLLNEELMAILLRTGTKEQSVLYLARDVLYHLEHLKDLETITHQELMRISGIKLAKATTILAAIELGRRLSQVTYQKEPFIKGPMDVYRLLTDELKLYDQEHFICLYLNTKSQLIAKKTIFIGTINQMIIHPREIFKHAVKYMAAAVLFVHNHPSGDATPSTADIKATKQLKDAGQLMGIDVVDHIIIGADEYYSFSNKNKTFL